MRKRGGRERALGTQAPMAVLQGQNLRRSLDFVMDTLVSGRRFRILTLVDDSTRGCLALVADTSLTSPRIVRELNRIVELSGYPHMIVSDNGTAFTSTRVSGIGVKYSSAPYPCRRSPDQPQLHAAAMTSNCICLSAAAVPGWG